MDIVAGMLAKIRAMASMRCLDHGDVPIGEDRGTSLGRKADKRIVEGAQDQGGRGDVIHYSSAGGAVVVVVGITETAVASNDLVVELAQGANGAESARLVDCREQRSL